MDRIENSSSSELHNRFFRGLLRIALFSACLLLVGDLASDKPVVEAMKPATTAASLENTGASDVTRVPLENLPEHWCAESMRNRIADTVNFAWPL